MAMFIDNKLLLQFFMYDIVYIRTSKIPKNIYTLKFKMKRHDDHIIVII